VLWLGRETKLKHVILVGRERKFAVVVSEILSAVQGVTSGIHYLRNQNLKNFRTKKQGEKSNFYGGFGTGRVAQLVFTRDHDALVNLLLDTSGRVGLDEEPDAVRAGRAD